MAEVDGITDPIISLREITASTLGDILRLAIAPEQTEYVATNAQSIAEAYFHPEAWFRGIYAGDVAVGFVMIEDWGQITPYRRDEPILLWRYMIDHRFQGRGYGKKALRLVIDHVRSRTRSDHMLTSYVPGPHSPKDFYLGYGFTPTGDMDGIEVILMLRF